MNFFSSKIKGKITSLEDTVTSILLCADFIICL